MSRGRVAKGRSNIYWKGCELIADLHNPPPTWIDREFYSDMQLKVYALYVLVNPSCMY